MLNNVNFLWISMRGTNLYIEPEWIGYTERFCEIFNEVSVANMMIYY